MARRDGTHQRQIAPQVLTPPRPSNLRWCCSTVDNLSRVPLSRKTSLLRSIILISSCNGLACSHSIFCDFGQLRGRGVGRSTRSAYHFHCVVSINRLQFCLGQETPHGSVSKENKGVSSVSDKHNPRHKRNRTFFWLPEVTYACCDAHENSVLFLSTPTKSSVS
jgi:hypothetical protein